MGVHHRGTGDAGEVIDATGKVQAIFVMVEAGGGQLVFEYLDRADDRAVRIVNGNGAKADWNFVSSLVVEESDGLRWVRGLDGAGQWTFLVAEFATGLVALQHGLSDAGVADDFMARPARDALSSIAPEEDFFLHVDDAKAGGQAIENAATNFGFMERRHE